MHVYICAQVIQVCKNLPQDYNDILQDKRWHIFRDLISNVVPSRLHLFTCSLDFIFQYTEKNGCH
jgi:hypothetical protein